MKRLVSIFVVFSGLVLSSVVSAQNLPSKVDSCPLALSADSIILSVYEDFQWFNEGSPEAVGLSKIPNESFSVNSADGNELMIGAGRNATADDGSVIWHFTNAENTDSESAENRQFNVQTPNGDAYLVGSDETLQVTLANGGGQVVELVSQIGCPGLLGLVYGPSGALVKSGTLLLAGFLGGGAVLDAILNDDDDVPAPPMTTPPVSSVPVTRPAPPRLASRSR